MRGNCTIRDCEKPLRSAEMCAMHWNRLLRNGSPSIVQNEVLGLSGTPEYKAWEKMKYRCDSPACDAYKYYGARGITYCKRWEKFSNFIADMGVKPRPELTLERKNNNGNYHKRNCKWATRLEQVHNKRPWGSVWPK